MQYKKTNKLANVYGFDPQSGCYSFTRDEREYLSLYDELFQQDEVPLEIRPIGEFLYLWYACFGKLEVYLNKEILCSVEKNTYLIDGESLYVGHSSGFYQYNLMNPITGEFLLSSHIPYELYVEDDVIIAYDNLRKKEIRRIDNSTEVFWSFPFVDLGEDNIHTPGEVDNIVKILGIIGGLLWFSTQFGRLVALDVATGKVAYQFSGNPADQDKVEYTQVAGLGDCFFREADSSIVCISYLGFQVFDGTTGDLAESCVFLEEDPDGIGRFDYLYAPNLQGDYFTFLAEMKTDRYGIGRVGIFDLKVHKLLWTEEIIPLEERKATGNHLVTPQPLYMSGDKLYIRDFQDTLHIFQRESWKRPGFSLFQIKALIRCIISAIRSVSFVVWSNLQQCLD